MMKIWIKRIFSVVMVLSMLACSTNTPQMMPSDDSSSDDESIVDTTTNVNEDNENTDENIDFIIDEEFTQNELNDAKKNSIAMLNYLAYLSQEVNSSKNSRMFLEEAYASLINNTNPEKVNELTESHMASLLDIIESYRMINVKRERLQYLYDQNKARAIQQAMPNPVALLSLTNSRSLKQLAASAIYMAVDSVNSYNSYNDELDQEFLQDGWTLDDEESANLHESRKRAFTFMIQIVREEELPGDLALNEKAIEDFVKWKNNTNNAQRIQFLESEYDTYHAFGNYWLLLADCYYENGEYAKTLEAITQYESLQADIFRKDYYFAHALPNAIVAASEIYEIDKYAPIAERYLNIIIENTENTEWSLRTFVSQIYMDLYAQTNDLRYLEKAYNVTLNNVNYLVNEQKDLNSEYLNDIKEVQIPENASKEEKKQIKKYNKELKENRKVELPTVYEPLKVNCEMLFALADELNVSESEKAKIQNILHASDIEIFTNDSLKNLFSFDRKTISIEGEFNKDELVLPVSAVSSTSVIKVTVTTDGKTNSYDNWSVKKVERETKDIDNFEATYTCKDIKKQDWNSKTTVKIEIFDDAETTNEPIVLNFKGFEKKKFAVLKTIEFEQVK